MGRNKFRNKLAKKYGADKIFENVDELMESNIINHADLVVEATGSNDILKKTVDIVAPSGKVFAFAVYPPCENVEINANKIYSKEISIYGDFINPYTMRKSINLIRSDLIDVSGMEDLKLNLDDVSKLFSSKTKNFIKPVIVFK
jgi:threonine dehydrogenase-like Zn-dependent dehydrogenase